MKKTFSSLSGSGDKKTFTIFSHDSKALQIHDFNVSHAYTDKNGQTTLSMATFIYDQKEENLTILFFFSSAKSSLKIDSREMKVLFNEGIYATYARQAIEKKLGTSIQNFISEFNI